MLFAEGSHKGEAFLDSCPGIQGAVRALFEHGAVGCGIGKRNRKFEGVGAGFCKRFKKRERRFGRRVAEREVEKKGEPMLAGALVEHGGKAVA